MSGILAKYLDLVVVPDRQRAIELHERVGRMSKGELDGLYAGSKRAGHVVLLESPGDPLCVLELVMSHEMGDALGTLFKAHPVFNSRQGYLEAREELLTLLEDFADAGPNGVAVFSPIRGRAVNVRDLGIQEMLDMIRVRVARATGSGAPSVH
jgi:hypothetical protein